MKSLLVLNLIVVSKSFNIWYRLLAPIALLIGLFLFPQFVTLYVVALLPLALVVSVSTVMTTEELKCRWGKYLPTLPVLPREVVISRYVFCGLCAVSTVIIASIFGLLSAFFVGPFTPSEIGWLILGGGVLGIIGIIISLPLGYLFEGEVAPKAIFTGLMLLVITLMMVKSTSLLPFLMTCSFTRLTVIAVIVLAMLIYGSYRIALFGYRKQLGLKR